MSREVRARLASPGGWGTHGSSTDHLRYAVWIADGRRRRARCPLGNDCPNRRTHYGSANGVALTSGCEFHVARWVRGDA
jgi:hypothetical protein